MAYADLTGRKVRIDVLTPGAPGGHESYTATVVAGPDFVGTITFRRHQDNFLGVAGLGAWVALAEPPR